MRSQLLLIPFVIDVALKVAAQMNPDALGRFSFPTQFGTIGFVPSVNDVLAFSLPVPNAWIWPVGWVVVVMLVRALLREVRQGNSARSVSSNVGVVAARIGVVRRCRWSPRTTTTLDDTSSATETVRRHPRQLALLALVLGAISNLTDRTFLGGVIDYLSFTNLFPAFNIADLLILGGIIGWLWSARTR